MLWDILIRLVLEYGDGVKCNRAVHLHDEDEWNEYVITYNGIIVGSELVGYDFIKNNIEKQRRVENG